MHQETEKRKFKEIFRKYGYKKSQNIFLDSGVLFCKPSKTFEKFHWPVKTVKLRE